MDIYIACILSIHTHAHTHTHTHTRTPHTHCPLVMAIFEEPFECACKCIHRGNTILKRTQLSYLKAEFSHEKDLLPEDSPLYVQNMLLSYS